MISKITKVTVFLQGAELTRRLNVDVHPGKNEIRFTGIPNNFELDSITAEVIGDAQLISVSSHETDLKRPDMCEEIEKLQQELKSCEEMLTENLTKQKILEDEYDFLQENRNVGGTQGIQLEELKKMEEYYRKRVHEINSERLSHQKEEKCLEIKKKDLISKLGNYKNADDYSYVDIVAELSAESDCKVEIVISYFVPCAGWRPVYEIRIKDTEHPAMLICKAEIYQNTGEDWNDISLLLSSGMPSIHGKPPELQPWYLAIEQPMEANACYEVDYSENSPEVLGEPYGCGSHFSPNNAEVRQACTSLEFVIPEHVSITALGNHQRVEITRQQLDASYQHYCIPKLDTDVFLLANIEGWETLDILEGEASIFLGNTYVGTTFIEPRKANSKMSIHLGKDGSVIASRVKGKDFTSSSVLNINNKISREWQITVRNTRHSDISIKILDQIPISASKSIIVEPMEISGAEYNTETGELCWERHLEASKSIELSIKYSVTYPKKGLVNIE